MYLSKKKCLVTLLSISSFFVYSCKQKAGLFKQVNSSVTDIDFVNKVEGGPHLNLLYYLYFYNGGGVAVGDINNDGLTDLYFTANSKGNNKLYLNKGNFQFEDITEKAGVAGSSDWCTGVTMADVNGDGFLDIYVSAVNDVHGLKGRNELFINNKNGTFTESAAKYGLDIAGFTTQTVFFDYDHDGDLDCFILNHSQRPHQNISDTSFRRVYNKNSGGRLLRNDINTTGKFTDVSAAAGIYQSSLGYGLGLAVADINNDGWDDIYIGNDFHENDYYYINNGNGTFTESGAQHFKHYSRFSMGNDVADYNNDGQLDIVTVDMLPPDEKTMKTYGSDENLDIYKLKIEKNGYQNQYSRNCLQLNNGNGASFSDVAIMNNVFATDWSWAPLFADFDNDGVKDLFISSGIVKRPVDLDYIRFVSDLYARHAVDNTDQYDQIAIDKMPDGASHPFLFKGNIATGFSDVSKAWGTAAMKGYFNGAAYADLDNDGDLDIVMNCINSKAVVLKNTTDNKKYISIAFSGSDANTAGIGCKAYLFQKGKLQYQQLMLTRGFQSSVAPRLHFGLENEEQVDSILVVWPNQQYQVLKNIAPGSHLLFKQANASGSFVYNSFFPSKPPVLEDITAQLNTTWKHRENDFLDFNTQYLIPHMQSTRGPKIAVADVNKDGREDFFVCGAKDQPGVLMIQTASGKFVAADTAVFNKYKASDGVDALFFDANGDSYPDLYVVSGGNELEDGNPGLADHLYLNDKKGHFVPAPDALPAILTNKSCVVAADVDKDGDMDIFIGGLADAKKYGIPQSSYLLLNDGKGHFTLAKDSQIKLEEIGMVTAASFADINQDGWPDLIVAGEWMPVKIFINHKGIFTESDIKGSTGLWQSMYATDINQDGFIDILAGNWGHNSKLYAGKNGPLKLFIKDFDKNGSVEQIMTYSVNGKDYTFLAKDELERSLPVLKKAYLTYGEVAGKTVDYMFYDLFKDYVELKAESLSSSCFMNDGKGGFKQVILPEALQMAPVFTFASVNDKPSTNYMAAGNFYGVVPYEGRYDALVPTFFSMNTGKTGFQTIAKLPLVDGEIRDAKWVHGVNGKKILVLARNNNSLLFYQLAK